LSHAREFDVGPAGKQGIVLDAAAVGFGQGAQVGAGSSTKITACGLPMDTAVNVN